LEEAVNLLHEPVIREQMQNAECRTQSADSEDENTVDVEPNESGESIFDPDEDFDEGNWGSDEDDEIMDADEDEESD